jgi:hypothetical protein
MGVAEGASSPSPSLLRVETVALRGTSIEQRVRWLADWLDQRLSPRPPDLIITEASLNPAASKDDHSMIDLFGYYFCLQTLAGLAGLRVMTAPVMTVRKHFCGIAHAPAIKGRKRTAAEAAEARKFINEAVLKRAILLGYLPQGSTDWDQANACALWDYAYAKYARAPAAAL